MSDVLRNIIFGLHTACRCSVAPESGGRARRRPGVPVIDTHAHWFPEEWTRLIERDGARHGGASIVRKGNHVGFSAGALKNGWTIDFVDLDLRLAKMDELGVDVHVLSLTTPMVYFAPPDFGLALSQVYNDEVSAAHLRHPDRLLGMAIVPMQAPELALKELERAAKLPGMRGLYLATHVNGLNLDEKAFFPIYAKCEELGWPIFLHPNCPFGAERLSRYFLVNLLGNPYETGVAAASLMFGGVLDTFPGLEVMLPHAGGAFPGLVGRLDHGTKVRAELAHMKEPPTSYLRRFSYDTIGHNDQIMLNLVKQVGVDRVVMGSDYCFDMGPEQPVDVVERLTTLSQNDRDLILGTNAARLLGMA
jgi:aminocarboxymuconate-semialdehyde decarboxylase